MIKRYSRVGRGGYPDCLFDVLRANLNLKSIRWLFKNQEIKINDSGRWNV